MVPEWLRKWPNSYAVEIDFCYHCKMVSVYNPSITSKIMLPDGQLDHWPVNSHCRPLNTSFHDWHQMNKKWKYYNILYFSCWPPCCQCNFLLPTVIRPGPWFNIKMTSYQYRKSHCGDKTVVRSSYLHNGVSYTCKMSSLYLISPLVPFTNNSRNNRSIKIRIWISNYIHKFMLV